MTYRNMFFQLLIAVFYVFTPHALIAGQRQMPPQMQDMESELAEANRAIEEYVASLPAEEQAEFNRAVEEMSQMFENMSDEDFDKFLGEMFNEEQMPQPDFYEAPQIIEEEVIEVPLLTEDQLKKVETATAILNDIIKQSNMFTVVISSAPELPSRINQWGKKGQISDWQEGMDWDALKLNLEAFVQKLYKVQEQDLATKKYKFLFDLMADEALYNNIVQLRTSLNTLVPTINIPEFGIQKLSSQSKTAIKNIINKYTESLYLLGLPQALDTLFEKYEPQAKKIRETEDAANKRAVESGKWGRFPAEATEAGLEPEEGYGGDYGYGSDYGDYGYGGGYGNDYGYGGGYNDYGNNYGSDTGFGGGRSGGSGGGSKSGGSERPSAGKKDVEENKDKKEASAEFVPNTEITEIIGKIKTSLEDINLLMTDEKYPELTNLVDHIKTEDQEVKTDLANFVFSTIDRKIVALSDNIKKIDSLAKKINSETLKIYQKEIAKAFNKNAKTLEKLSKDIAAFEPMTASEKKLPTEEQENLKKIDVAGLPLDKQWAYFANEDIKDELDEQTESTFTEKVTNPKSLFTVKEHIDSLIREVKEFNKKKIVDSAAKKPAKVSE